MQAFTPEEERAEQASRVRSMLQRWSREPDGAEPDWRVEDLEPLSLRHVETHEVLVSEVCDYELRRELLRLGALRSLSHLDELSRELRYLPVTTTTWRSAARLWAMARRAGRPTASPDSLDGDVLLAAQARAEDATIVTTNARHFELFASAVGWEDVPA
jgi:predicted nucleic acid-binding protein